MSTIYEKLATVVIEGDSKQASALVQQGLAEGLTAKEILDNGLIVGMGEVGARFKRGDMFVPEVLMSAEAMQAGLQVLRPLLASSGAKLIGKVVLGTVKGDLHDIGKNLVGMMCEGSGFEVIDLGFNVPPERFVDAVKEHKPDVVGLSALLTTTMRPWATPSRRWKKPACVRASKSWSAARLWTPSSPSALAPTATAPTPSPGRSLPNSSWEPPSDGASGRRPAACRHHRL